MPPVDPPFPCPCCGYLVFEQGPGSYDTCPVCGWEDDIAQLRFPTTGGTNRPLLECQTVFAEHPQWLRHVVDPPLRLFVRDPTWRRFDHERDELELPVSGVDYGHTYDADHTVYYYWRRRS